jgi:vitamin B12 transporter
VINNVIQYVIVDPATYASMYRNVNKQQNSGVEVEFFVKSNKLNLHTNYTYTHAKITTAYTESGSELSQQKVYDNLYRVPKHAVNVFASYAVSEKLSLSSLIKYAGNRYEPIYLSIPVKLDEYITWDISAAYKLNSRLRFFADFKNIMNIKYFDLLGYNNKRFNFMAGLSVQL